GVHDGHAGRGAHDRGLDKVTRPCERAAAAQQCAALRLRCGDGRKIARDRARIDQRAHQGARLERIADAYLAVGGDQAALEFRRPRMMDQYAAGGGAALTRGAHSAVFGEGFHTVALPAMAARKAFQDHTATGKLKAEITPTTPSGCHCSYMRCSTRSECIVKPYIMRDWPTAKSAMSIIS